MADFDVPGLHLQTIYTGPDGNFSRAYVQVARAALAAGDRVFCMPTPVGMQIHNVNLVIYDAAAAGDVIDIGLIQKGKKATVNPFVDDIDKFFDGYGIHAVGGALSTMSGTMHAPFLVAHPKVFLAVGAPAGNAIATPFGLRLYVDYEFKGTP